MLSRWRPAGFAVPFDDVDDGVGVVEKCVLHGLVDVNNALTGPAGTTVTAFGAATAAAGLGASG